MNTAVAIFAAIYYTLTAPIWWPPLRDWLRDRGWLPPT